MPFLSRNYHTVFGEQIAIFYQIFKSGSSKKKKYHNLQRWNDLLVFNQCFNDNYTQTNHWITLLQVGISIYVAIISTELEKRM